MNNGDFALAAGTTCSNGATVAAQGQCVINVAFKPTAAGSRAGAITVTDNAASSPQTITLSGTGGTDFSFGAASGSPTSTTLTAGSSATYKLSITGPSGFSQAIALSCAWVSAQPQGAACSVSPSSITANGSTATATVTVTTTARSMATPGHRGSRGRRELLRDSG